MEIRIKRSLNQQIRCDQINLRILKRRTTIAVLMFFFIAFLIILVNFFTANNFILYLFGCLFFAPGIGIIKFIRPSIRNGRKVINAQISKTGISDHHSELILNDNYLFCKTTYFEDNFQWKEFRRFIVYKSCIYITTGKGFETSFVIMQNEISGEELSELLSFLERTVKRFG